MDGYQYDRNANADSIRTVVPENPDHAAVPMAFTGGSEGNRRQRRATQAKLPRQLKCLPTSSGSAKTRAEEAKAAACRIADFDASDRLRTAVDAVIAAIAPNDTIDRFDFIAKSGGAAVRANAGPALNMAFDRFAKGEVTAIVVRAAYTVPEGLEQTPRRGPPSLQSRALRSAPAFFLCAAGLEAIAYSNENEGDPLRDIVTKEGNEASLSSHGVASHFHTEHAQRPDDGADGVSPAVDAFGFGCLRNARLIPTDLCILDIVCDAMMSFVPLLEEPSQSFRPSESTTDTEITRGLPILNRTPFGNQYRFNQAQIERHEDPRMRAALDIFAPYLEWEEALISVALRPGDILLVNQRQVAHRNGGRGQFDPERWLSRVFGMRLNAPSFPDPIASKSWVRR